MKKSKTSFLFTLLLFFFCQIGIGQIFNNSYTTQELASNDSRNTMNMVVDPDGSTVTVSTIMESNSNKQDAHVIKVDDNGNLIWSRNYGLPNISDHGNSICQTDDGGYLITGMRSKPNYIVEVWIFKIDNSGVLQWSKWYSDDNLNQFYGSLITRTFEQQETYLIVGNIISGPTYPVSALKIDDSGNIIWSNQYYDPSMVNTVLHSPTSMTRDVNNNGYIIVGIEQDISMGGSQFDLFSFGVDIDGNLGRPYIKYDQNNDQPPSITRGFEDDGYAVTFGVSGSNVQPGISVLTGFMKLDENLEPEWTNLYAATSDLFSMPKSLHVDPHGFYDMGLTTIEQCNALRNPTFLKIDLLGNPVSYWKYNLFEQQRCLSMAQDITGLHENYVLKTTHIANGIPSIGLIRTEINGDSECGLNIPNVNVYPVSPTFVYQSYEMFTHDIFKTDSDITEYHINTSTIDCNNANLTEQDDDRKTSKLIEAQSTKSTIIDGESLIIYPTFITKESTNLKIEYNTKSEGQTTIRIYNVLGALISKTHFKSYNGLNIFNIENISIPQGMNTIGIYKNEKLVATEKLLRM